MCRSVSVGLAFMIGATWALAETRQDCVQHANLDLRVRACSEIIRSDAGAAWAYVNRGTAYRLGGDHDRAVADYSKVIEIDPQHGDAYFFRGIAKGVTTTTPLLI